MEPSKRERSYDPNLINNNDARKAIEKLENMRNELHSQNIELNDRLLQREETMIKRENEIKLLRNENDAMKEE